MSTTDVTPETRSAPDVLARSRALFDPPLREAVDSLPGSMRHIAGYHFGWWDEVGSPIDGDPGKALRPTLVLSAAEAVAGVPGDAVPAAVAVELVHNFTLLHDDVMDGDRTRRHRAAAWSVFGTGQAILAGDALLTLAYEVLTASAHPAVREASRVLSHAVLAVQDGQAADLSFERRTDVELGECVRMAEHKTAALLGCATGLGALFGGAPADRVGHLREFGEHIGLAFQLVDDILGIWGDPTTTGKPVHADLTRRKKSLPVVAALAADTQESRTLAAFYHGEGGLSAEDAARAADLIDRAGGRAWCQSTVDELLAHALDDLRLGAVATRPAADLAALALLITRRDH